MPERSLAIGLGSAVAVIFIWSGFLVTSRLGVQTALTPYDVAALRFLVAGALTSPFVLKWWPRDLAWWKAAVLALSGPGTIYALLLYTGLQYAPAAYAGVFCNGSLPICTMLLSALIARDYPGPRRMLAVALIVVGGAFVAWRGLAAGGADVWTALSLFLLSSLLLSTYIWGLGRWGVGPTGALAVINIPNLIAFLPIWWFLLPSGLEAASLGDIALQAIYQGLGPGFLAVIFFALSARHLGATPTAGFSAAVPAGAAILAIPVLGEVLTPLEWGGVGLVTLGLIVLVIRKS